MLNLNEKVFVVTGASKGIGFDTVIEALQRGYNVVGTSRNAEQLTELVATKVPQLMDKFMAISMNFDEESIHHAVDAIVTKFGRIDVLVNNAGYAILGPLEEMSMTEVHANFNVNVFGLLMMTQAVLPHMRQQRTGQITNIASISGTVTGPSQGIYSATKAAVIMMSEALAYEVASFNIHVTAICPGGIRTDFLDDRSMKRPEKESGAYHVVNQTMDSLSQLNHNQSGDPRLVAKVLVDLPSMEDIPTRLYLGYGAIRGLEQKVNTLIEEANKNVKISMSIDN